MAESNIIVKSNQENIEIEDFKKALLDKGLTPDKMASVLASILDGMSVKINKNGDFIEYVDWRLKLQAVDTWSKLFFDNKKSTTLHNHLHLTKANEDKLDELESKCRKTRVVTEKVPN